MGILGSTFGRALAGGGEAAASIASRYIDDEILRNRAQAMADIQRTSAVRQAQELDQYQNSDERQARLRVIADENARSASKTAQGIKLDELNNEALNEAGRKKSEADKRAERDAANAQTIRDAGNAELLAASTKIKLADPEVAARIAASRAAINASNAQAGLIGAQTAGVKIDVEDKRKLNGLYEQASSILSNAKLTDEDRAAQLGKVQQQIVLMKSKNGQAVARDPELDTETIVEKSMDANGNEITKTRKEVRRPGAQQQSGASPFKEGEEIRGKSDGKIYVVRDGVPVLKEQVSAPSARPAAPSPAPASTMPSTMTGNASIDAITTAREQKLAGVVEQYKAAKAELQAAARAGQQQEAVAAANKLQSIRNEYIQAANTLFGNGAQRYIDQLNTL